VWAGWLPHLHLIEKCKGLHDVLDRFVQVMFRRESKTFWMITLALVLAGATLSFAQNHRNDRDNQNRGNNSNNQNRGNTQNRPNDQSGNRQGHHAGQWLRQYQNVPRDQQQKALNNDPEFKKLPPERQERLRQRLDRFNSLPPDRQQQILNRMETWEHLTPQQKSEARQVFSGIRNLPPERRQAMQNAVEALRAMPPGARQRAIESGRFSQFSPQERDLLNGVSKLPLAPSEAPNEQTPDH
jgi:hypothetical protein